MLLVLWICCILSSAIVSCRVCVVLICRLVFSVVHCFTLFTAVVNCRVLFFLWSFVLKPKHGIRCLFEYVCEFLYKCQLFWQLCPYHSHHLLASHCRQTCHKFYTTGCCGQIGSGKAFCASCANVKMKHFIPQKTEVYTRTNSNSTRKLTLHQSFTCFCMLPEFRQKFLLDAYQKLN